MVTSEDSSLDTSQLWASLARSFSQTRGVVAIPRNWQIYGEDVPLYTCGLLSWLTIKPYWCSRPAETQKGLQRCDEGGSVRLPTHTS